jgi:NTP pyrophosphatase (non-canonical NTP hydrolase)
MNPSEYQKLARRTATPKFLEDQNFGLVNWALGLAGEAGEVFELVWGEHSTSNLDPSLLKKELGDVCWYIALFCEQVGFDLGTFGTWVDEGFRTTPSNDRRSTSLLVTRACKTADYVKKVVCHGHPLDEQTLHTHVHGCYRAATAICSRHGLSMSDVMKENIEKLKARYPEGFSTERSLNRE